MLPRIEVIIIDQQKVPNLTCKQRNLDCSTFARIIARELKIEWEHFFRTFCGRPRGACKPNLNVAQRHARQLYSLALTRFYSIRESSTTNAWNVWNIIESESVNLGHFLFMSRLINNYYWMRLSMIS